MLPSDLNKFKYINNTINFNEEQLADLLLLLDDNRTRSQFILAIEKNKKNSKPVKPSVEVREYMTTTARYVEKKNSHNWFLFRPCTTLLAGKYH